LSPDLSLPVQKHPELTKLIQSWSMLPAAVRMAIMAMIYAAIFNANDSG
jgi:hypothetical protein